jgi:hypothetical protein
LIPLAYAGVETPVFHPSDKDPSLHPSEQRSLTGAPESLGTPASLRIEFLRCLYGRPEACSASGNPLRG